MGRNVSEGVRMPKVGVVAVLERGGEGVPVEDSAVSNVRLSRRYVIRLIVSCEGSCSG